MIIADIEQPYKNMKMKRSKPLRLLIVLSIILIGIYFYTSQQKEDTAPATQVDQPTEIEQLLVDFDGSGKPTELTIQEFDEGYKLFNSSGTELFFNDDVYPRSMSQYKVVRLNEESKKEYIQWDNIVGPHQTQTFFYTMFNNNLQAIPAFDFENNTHRYAFYNSRNELGVGDFTKDGLVEVVETVDEYPPDAPRLDTSDLDKVFRETFNKEGLSEDDMEDFIEIVRRENNGIGRGGVVIWSIYSFVESEAPFFRKLDSDEYNEIANRYVSAMNEAFQKTDVDSKLMKISDLEQGSIDFNTFVRDVWTHGNNYEYTTEEN